MKKEDLKFNKNIVCKLSMTRKGDWFSCSVTVLIPHNLPAQSLQKGAERSSMFSRLKKGNLLDDLMRVWSTWSAAAWQ